MKVLREGPGWSVQQVCTGKGNGNGGCDSLLEVERDDIYLTSHTDYVGDTEYYYTFRCPICSVETDIQDNYVPGLIKEKLLRTRRTER